MLWDVGRGGTLKCPPGRFWMGNESIIGQGHTKKSDDQWVFGCVCAKGCSLWEAYGYKYQNIKIYPVQIKMSTNINKCA